MDDSGARVDHTAASQGKEQAAGGDKISVETFEEREQRGRENDVDDPTGAQRLLKGDGGHKFLAGQLMPGSDESNGHDDAGVEQDADEDRHPDRAKEATGTEVRAGLFGRFADGFEAGHEIGDDLNHQQNRDERSMREQRRKVNGRAAAYA